MKIRAIITGVTGMVGEGVMHECLLHPEVEAVLIINRKPSGFSHAKLKEIVHADFFNFAPIADQLTGYNACYFCLGVSSVGMKEPEFIRLTYDLTMHVAKTIAPLNPAMTFCYVSGSGTDTSEKGNIMWARVKGKTENDLQNLPFAHVYAFRPGYIQPIKGLKNAHKAYKYISWLYAPFRAVFPSFACSLEEVGLAMIEVTLKGYGKKILEVKDIVKAAHDNGVH